MIRARPRRDGTTGYQPIVYDPQRGRKIAGSTQPTKKLARKVERNMEAEFAKAHRSTDETCRSFATRWPDDYPRPRRSTQAHYRDQLKPFIREFADRPLAAVDRREARAFALAHPGSYPPVRAMYNDAVEDGLVETNPFLNLRIPKSRGRKDITALTIDEVHAIADLCERVHGIDDYGPTMRAAWLVAAFTGIRPGELYDLEHADVLGDELRVRTSYSSKVDEVTAPKTGRSRIVVLPGPARDAIKTVPRRLDSPLIFHNKSGDRIRQPAMHGYWHPVRTAWLATLPASHWLPRRIAARAAENARRRADGKRPLDSDHLDLYEGRHFCATHLLEQGLSSMDVAVQLGHTNARLVEEVYGHPSDVAARQRIKAAFGDNVRPMLKPIDAKEATG